MRPAHGNDIILGSIVGKERRPLTLRADERDKHLYVCGATGTGKSKFLENLIRQDIIGWRKSKCGLLLIDPHGSLFDDLMAWLAWHQPHLKRPVIPIDLRRKDWVIGYNVLRPRAVADPAVIVSNFVQAMAYVWGQSGTEATPLFNRWASNIIGTLYENKLTLLEAEHLTDRMANELRRAMTGKLSNKLAARDWAYANSLTPKDFEQQISSTINRLHSFLSTQAIRQMLGQTGTSLDLGEALEAGHIILVSLATEHERVSDEDASLFATLLLNDLWTAAKERGKGNHGEGVKPFYVYVDEFQNFVTPTIAKNLDQARGFGLNLTLAHQFPNQLLHTGAHGKQVYDSISVNARSKVVFSIEGEENLKPLAQSLFMGAMNPDKIKHELYSTKVMGYVEEYRTAYARSRSEGHGHGSQSGGSHGEGFGGTILNSSDGLQSRSESWSRFGAESNSQSNSWSEAAGQSETESPMLIPVMGKELSSVQFESLEEQLFRAMAVLFDQQQRQCVVRTVGSRLPVSLHTPTVKEVIRTFERTERYTQTLLERCPFALRVVEAQKRLADRDIQINEQFLPKTVSDEPVTARRRVRLST